MITLNNINFSYTSKEIFSEASVEISKGEFVFVVGESGIGKTTLLKLIYFDVKPKSGTVIFDDYNSGTVDKTEIPFLRRKIGIVFQDFKLLNDRNIFENIALPLYIANGKKESIKKRVFDIASKLGLIEYLNIFPYDLSGGEQQRVAIARAMITEPILLIADEPTGNLDPFVAMDIVKLLNDINKTGTTLIMATHNFDIVKKFADKRILQLKDRKLFDVRLKA
ncbi:MAG: ATP-binding cassette domain-containing protein [Ignavibacteriota bacterium]|nr:ATP-binding cassette domain-containing protein [Ignavibacteriota bacterium]